VKIYFSSKAVTNHTVFPMRYFKPNQTSQI